LPASEPDAEVARPSRLRREHQKTIFKLRSRVRHLIDDIPRLEKRLEIPLLNLVLQK
jgi:hypothetical protein